MIVDMGPERITVSQEWLSHCTPWSLVFYDTFGDPVRMHSGSLRK